MPAPKGNKNATKEHAKRARFEWRLSVDVKEKLEELAADRKISPSELLEILVVREFQQANKK